MSKQKGITLVALIVTIIVLIILAGISINLILGENGIITKVSEAKQIQEIAEIKSEMQLEIAAKEAEILQNAKGLTQVQIEEILEKFGTINKENGEIVSLTPIGKDYEIPYEEIYKGELYSDIPSELERYFLGENKEGVALETIAQMSQTAFGTMSATFIGNSIIEDANTKIMFLNYMIDQENMKVYMDIAYENKATYKITIDAITEKCIEIEKKYDVRKLLPKEKNFLSQEGVMFSELGVSDEMSITREYVVEVLINNELYCIKTIKFYDYILAVLGEYEVFRILPQQEGGILSQVECTLINIYDMGPAMDYVEENNFIACYSYNENLWYIFKTPNSEYTVSTEVAGKKIDAVELGFLKGTPTFSNEFIIKRIEPIVIQKIKVTTQNVDFIFVDGSVVSGIVAIELDFSECGDDITIPNQYIEDRQSSSDANGVIYVSPAVKEKYPDYEFIIAKE